ncbi:MAG: hypothetical protein CM15mP89_2390 [Gammaproteobacteria bacterium]|nr:MAG: hypothetical protein CM15mP89_2390 [Gammaproteobacteria bacterium]
MWDLVKAVSFRLWHWVLAISFTGINVARHRGMVYWLLLFVGIRGLRLISRGWLQANTGQRRRVIIYGPVSRSQLLNALNHGTDYRWWHS